MRIWTACFCYQKIIELIRAKVEVNNIDSVIVAERPKIKPYVDSMRKTETNTLEIYL